MVRAMAIVRLRIRRFGQEGDGQKQPIHPGAHHLLVSQKWPGTRPHTSLATPLVADLLFRANHLLWAATVTRPKTRQAALNAADHAPDRPRRRDRQGPTGLHRLLRRMGDRSHLRDARRSGSS